MHRLIPILALTLILAAACKKAEVPPQVAEEGVKTMALKIESDAFAHQTAIPKKFTCDGNDVSPALRWSGVPGAAKSLALICDDPDAPMGTWTHWVLWNMPPSTPGLPEGVPPDSVLPGGIHQEQNSWPKSGYGGPCPPPANPHRYFFKLFALVTALELPVAANQTGLENAMRWHVLAQAQF